MKNVKITISKDRLEAFMTISDYNNLRLSDIVSAIQEAGLSYGIIGTNIKAAFDYKITDRLILIARGIPPQHGQDGFFEKLIDISPKPETIFIEGDSDYFPVWITNVKKGQKLFKITPHTQGIPGISINGNPILARPGKPVRPIRGKNTRFSPYDSNYLVSEENGNLVWDDLRANVYPDYKVNGNLGFLNGDIFFIGNLIVTGNVNPGVTIKTGGNIEIWGNVEDSSLEAEGNINIRGGFFGKGNNYISAKGDISVSIVDNQTVKSLRNIYIRKECVNAQVSAFSIIAPDASIFGGLISAFETVEVKELGKSQNVITKVSIGSKLHKMNLIREIDKDIRIFENQIRILTENANSFFAKKMKTGFLTPDEEFDYLTTKDEIRDLAEKIKVLIDRREYLISKMNDRINPRLIVNESIYPNVLLSINDLRMENSRIYSNSVFFERDDGIFRASLPKFKNLL